MKHIKELSTRLENPERYDSNQKVNALIHECFTNSVSHYNAHSSVADIVVSPAHVCNMVTYDTPYFISKYDCIRTGELPYASTTIEAGGPAIPCFQQGLTLHGVNEDIRALSKLIGDLHYYEDNKGTWHQLFDHWGLRRATHYMEVYEALQRMSIVTVLVENKYYIPNDLVTGRNWVNIVGIDGDTFYIDDPALGRVFVDAYGLLKSVVFAWIW